MTQRNLRGAYYVPTHDRKEDWDWLGKWQPNVIRYMTQGKPEDPNSVDVERVKRLHDTCPDATILMRCWDVDDRNFAAHDAMVADPRAEAERQVDWWAKVFDHAVAAGVPRAQLMAGLNNETGPEKDMALYDYTEAALNFGIQKSVRLCVYIFSVGRPSLAGEKIPDIPYFSRLDALIQQNGGAVGLNEYMQPEGMYAVWTDEQGSERKDYTYLIGRHTRWQIKSDIIITEWGIDGLLYNRHPDKVYGNSGWTNFKDLWPPSRYADEYVECIKQASDNVIGICPFLEDWNDHKWQSFDLIEAYGEFIARKDLCVKESATPPIETHLPAIDNGPSVPSQPAPTYSGIIEPLVAQAILQVESGGHAFGNDGKVLIRFEAHIFRSQLKNDAVWQTYFDADPDKPWLDQEWRASPTDHWRSLHINSQAEEYMAFEFAKSLNADAAYNSISVGAPQIMGFNHARVGFATAQAMYEAFGNEALQTIAFINYFLSDPTLAQAMRDKDWRTIAKLYNGSGAIDSYSKLLQDAYQQLGGGV